MARSLRTILNEASPGKLPDANRLLPMGEALSLVPRSFKGPCVASLLTLPEDAKCAVILQAFAQGTVPGYKTPALVGTAPGTGVGAPTPDGNILFNEGTDAILEAEVIYLSYEGAKVSEALLQVGTPVADEGVLLGERGASVLISVIATAGGSTGVKTVAVRSAAAPGAGVARLSLDGKSVTFAAADAVTAATVIYIATPGVGSAPDAVGTTLDAEVQEF